MYCRTDSDVIPSEGQLIAMELKSLCRSKLLTSVVGDTTQELSRFASRE